MGPSRFPDGAERRGGVEIRAAGRRLEGYAATFGTEARIGGFVEVIQPGAFRASLAGGKDVIALVDHDPTRLLARTASGSLRLTEDARGLSFSIDVPDTQLGHDILALAIRGDIGGMSFGFRTKDEAWPTTLRRELRAVDLIEISVVQSFPAYSQTTVSARARQIGHNEAAARIRRMILETL